MQINTGMVAGDFDAENQKMFVVECKALSDLVHSLVRPCLCSVRACWTIHTFIQVSILSEARYNVHLFVTCN